MTNGFNHLDPMNRSTYLESYIPNSLEESIDMVYNPNYVPPQGLYAGGAVDSKPHLRPQPTKDTWYYNNDGADDGKISFSEKMKAFIKGGTYNMVKGMFCDENGFSLKRTFTTGAAIAAIAATGPIGAAIAGGIGLIAAGVNFVKSVKNASGATTDKQARAAYEGIGETTTTAALSLFGGYKGFQSLKTNFAKSGGVFSKLTNWKVPAPKAETT